jgi:iron(III) transport system permease protein
LSLLHFPFIKLYRGFLSREGVFDLTYFARYFDSYYGPNLRRIFVDTMTMGLLTATFGTLVGFIFAYATVRCQIPGKRIIHWLALLPTISPPFALALSMILLFGRNGLITRRVSLGMFIQPG